MPLPNESGIRDRNVHDALHRPKTPRLPLALPLLASLAEVALLPLSASLSALPLALLASAGANIAAGAVPA